MPASLQKLRDIRDRGTGRAAGMVRGRMICALSLTSRHRRHSYRFTRHGFRPTTLSRRLGFI